MTISTRTVINGPYTPNGIRKEFPYGFAPLTAGELRVFRRTPMAGGGTVDTDMGGYRLSVLRAPGNVIFDVAPVAGGTIYVAMQPLWLQGQDITSQDLLDPAVLEDFLDRSTQRDLYLLHLIGDRLMTTCPNTTSKKFSDDLFPSFYQQTRYPDGVCAPPLSMGSFPLTALNKSANDILPHLIQLVAANGGSLDADVTAWWKGGQPGLGYNFIDVPNPPAPGQAGYDPVLFAQKGYFAHPLEKTFGFYHFQGRNTKAHTVFECISENHCSERMSMMNGAVPAPMYQWRSANEGRTYGEFVFRQKTSVYTGISRYNLFLVHINEGTKEFAEHGGLYIACRSVPGPPDPADGNQPTPATSKFHGLVVEVSNFGNFYHESAATFPDTGPEGLKYPYSQISGKRGTFPNPLVGCEVDIVTADWQSLAYEHVDYMSADLGFGFTAHHKHAYTSVCFGGGRILAGLGIFNPGYRPIGPHPNVVGSSAYSTGYHVNGILAHAHSIDPNEGRFLNCLSSCAFLLRINGMYSKIKEAGIDLQPQIASVGNVGLRVGVNIARPIELLANKAIWLNGGAGTQNILYDSALNAVAVTGLFRLETVALAQAAGAAAGTGFASDAAASTGGIPIHGVYHNAGALRIRVQ